ncbi:hypothetical protein H0H93_013816 [Arthromyces matolae]|nr:hypothetical protein H0H93_013816 [Arthromyces matolae]
MKQNDTSRFSKEKSNQNTPLRLINKFWKKAPGSAGQSLAPSPSPIMKTLLKQTVIGAVLVFTTLSLVVATPIPVPITGSEPHVVPVELFNDTVPLKTTGHIAPLPIAVDDPGLLARDPTDTEKNPRKPTPITIPPGFLPGESDGDLQMALPCSTDRTWWASVINILSLMKAATERNTKLKQVLHAFEVELEGKEHVGTLGDIYYRWRPTESTLPTQAMAELDLDLKTIQDRIKTAVEKHNEFEGEIQIPKGFLPGTTELGMKIPHPDNTKAVKSVESILKLMQSAIDRDDKGRMRRYRLFKATITRTRFKLVFEKSPKYSYVAHLEEEDLHAIQRKIKEAVERHNNNYWWNGIGTGAEPRSGARSTRQRGESSGSNVRAGEGLANEGLDHDA